MSVIESVYYHRVYSHSHWKSLSYNGMLRVRCVSNGVAMCFSGPVWLDDVRFGLELQLWKQSAGYTH